MQKQIKYLFHLILVGILLYSCQPHTRTAATTKNSNFVSIHVPKIKNKNHLNAVQQIPLLAGPQGEVYDSLDIAAQIFMGWTEKALLIKITVDDNYLYLENPSAWEKDGVEIFIAPQKGIKKQVQYAINPTENTDVKILTQNIEQESAARAVFTSIKSRQGYQIVGEIPFAIFDSTSYAGNSYALQVYVNDVDSLKSRKRLILAPLEKTHINPFAYKTIQLSDTETKNPFIAFRLETLDDSLLIIKALAKASYSGDTIKAISGTHHFAPFILQNEEQIAIASDTFSFTDAISQASIIKFIHKGSIIEEIPLALIPKKYIAKKPTGRFALETGIFATMDAIQMPPKKATVVTGSSSIRMWHSIHEDLAPLEIIHRGFGGSTAKDLLVYMDSLILKYEPDTVIIYEGDNDMMGPTTVDEFIGQSVSIIDRIDSAFPGTYVYFVSIKPSPSRRKVMHKIMSANDRLRLLADEKENVGFIDIMPPMLTERGEIKSDIFLSDSVHMNEQGYAIWKEVFRRQLIKQNH